MRNKQRLSFALHSLSRGSDWPRLSSKPYLIMLPSTTKVPYPHLVSVETSTLRSSDARSEASESFFKGLVGAELNVRSMAGEASSQH